LIGRFGSDQINRNELIPELLEEFNKIYLITESLSSELSQLKDRYDCLINLIISLPEVQNDPSLKTKIQQFFTKDSQS
jgi:hypothetical protein